MSILKKVLRSGEGKKLKALEALVPVLNETEDEVKVLTDDQLRGKTVEFRQRLDNGEDVDDILVDAFAVVREAAWRVIDATNFISITANLGDTKSTITHPATTTHGRLSDEQKLEAGIVDGLVRVSVGLENIDDIIADLARGLA